MILTFHKIAESSKTPWYLSSDRFRSLLTRLSGKEVVYLDDYDPDNGNHVVISFDGVYKDIVRHGAPYLQSRGMPFECFIVGDVVGRDNSFDKDEPLENFCSVAELHELQEMGGRLQWHSRSHRDMSRMTQDQIQFELEVPRELKNEFSNPLNFRHFAFPHGRISSEALSLALNKFSTASLSDHVEVPQGFRGALNRINVFEDTKLGTPSIGVVVANYNYTNLLPSAVRSLQRQSLKPDVVHISDDASTDGAHEVLASFEPDYPVFRNEKNLGIVDHFNLAVSRLGTDYCLILGADNELRSDALERLYIALNSSPNVAVAYSDMLIFGPESEEYATRVDLQEIGFSRATNSKVYVRRVPDFSEITFSEEYFPSIMHGSSLFKKAAFEDVGGYKPTYPEDHNLWHRMLLRPDTTAVRVPHAILRYRQHSGVQASNVLYLYSELARLRSANSKLKEQMGNPLVYLVNRSLAVLFIQPLREVLRQTWLSDRPIWIKRRSKVARWIDKLPARMRRLIYRIAISLRG